MVPPPPSGPAPVPPPVGPVPVPPTVPPVPPVGPPPVSGVQMPKEVSQSISVGQSSSVLQLGAQKPSPPSNMQTHSIEPEGQSSSAQSSELEQGAVSKGSPSVSGSRSPPVGPTSPPVGPASPPPPVAPPHLPESRSQVKSSGQSVSLVQAAIHVPSPPPGGSIQMHASPSGHVSAQSSSVEQEESSGAVSVAPASAPPAAPQIPVGRQIESLPAQSASSTQPGTQKPSPSSASAHVHEAESGGQSSSEQSSGPLHEGGPSSAVPSPPPVVGVPLPPSSLAAPLVAPLSPPVVGEPSVLPEPPFVAPSVVLPASASPVASPSSVVPPSASKSSPSSHAGDPSQPGSSQSNKPLRSLSASSEHSPASSPSTRAVPLSVAFPLSLSEQPRASPSPRQITNLHVNIPPPQWVNPIVATVSVLWDVFPESVGTSAQGSTGTAGVDHTV